MEDENGLGRQQSALRDSLILTDSRSQPENISPVQQEHRDEQARLDTNRPATGSREPDFHDYISHALSGETQSTTSDGDWPEEFSLDARPGYSTQLIGLSNESDPFLLRHYRYDMLDNHTMFRLDYRKITDDVNLQSHIRSIASCGTPKIPASEIPIQFVMIDKRICEENVKAVEKDFSVHNSETEDCALLKKIVPEDLGFRLLKL